MQCRVVISFQNFRTTYQSPTSRVKKFKKEEGGADLIYIVVET
jgi:hypothetical protein